MEKGRLLLLMKPGHAPPCCVSAMVPLVRQDDSAGLDPESDISAYAGRVFRGGQAINNRRGRVRRVAA